MCNSPYLELVLFLDFLVFCFVCFAVSIFCFVNLFVSLEDGNTTGKEREGNMRRRKKKKKKKKKNEGKKKAKKFLF